MYESWMCGDTVYGGAWVLSHITFHISHFQSESLCFAPNPSRSTFSGSRMGGRGGRVGHIFITFSYFLCLSLSVPPVSAGGHVVSAFLGGGWGVVEL